MKQQQYSILISLACFMSALFMGALVILVLLNSGPLNLISNTLGGIQICIGGTFVQCLFILLLSWMYRPKDYKSKPSVFIQALNVVKSLGILLIGSFIFHAIAVFFGAPFFESTSKTYHFALLLSSQVCFPFCLFLGPDIDAWLKVFMKNSCEEIFEVLVYFTSICAVLGAWLGAVPIPLDWDRPWQEWPISCVAGASLGYAGGLLISAAYIPRLHRPLHKTKFF